MENKPASSLVVSLGKALNGLPHLYVEDRWPRFPSEKQAGHPTVKNKCHVIKMQVVCCGDPLSGKSRKTPTLIYTRTALFRRHFHLSSTCFINETYCVKM